MTQTPRLGLRIKHARTTRGMTQETLSAALGFNDRQTLSDIENGKRSVKAEELLLLSDIFDQEVEYFVDPISVVGEATFAWRASSKLPDEVLKDFEAKAVKWVGLLRWMRENEGVGQDAFQPSLKLDANSTYEEAIAAGERVAKKLALGQVPAERLAERVEDELDIPVLYMDGGRRSPSISGAACRLTGLRIVLINRLEGAGRRNFDLAHELFHCLTWDAMAPAHRESAESEKRTSSKAERIERLANNFASALLMPRETLERFIAGKELMDPHHLADVAEVMQVTPSALAWRLFNLDAIDEQTRDRLAKFKSPSDEADAPRLFSRRFVELLHVSLDKGRLSPRKAAKLLDLPLSELTALFETYGTRAPFSL